MLHRLLLASFASLVLLTPTLVTAQTANFQIEEATIEDIQGAILRGELTSTRLVSSTSTGSKRTTARASISRMGCSGRSHPSRTRIKSMR